MFHHQRSSSQYNSVILALYDKARRERSFLKSPAARHPNTISVYTFETSTAFTSGLYLLCSDEQELYTVQQSLVEAVPMIAGTNTSICIIVETAALPGFPDVHRGAVFRIQRTHEKQDFQCNPAAGTVANPIYPARSRNDLYSACAATKGRNKGMPFRDGAPDTLAQSYDYASQSLHRTWYVSIRTFWI